VSRKREYTNAPGPTVAVVGSGFAGIAVAVALTKSGLDNFTILEKSSGVGGVWRDNVYPGVEVDTPSHLYSYSFKAHDWPRVYATRPELLDYLEETVDDYGLGRHLRFGATVTRLVWDEAGQGYDVYLADGETLRFDVVISAVGLLGVPNYPDWPGLAQFRGQRFHTSRWDDTVELSGRRVAVVGTGSTAAQVVPAVAAVAGRLTVFQREPGWVDPKDNPEYSEAQRARLRNPVRRRIERTRLYWRSEVRWIGGRIANAHSRVESKARQVCLDFLDAEFAARPDLKALLTPRHPYLGKRPIHSGGYYAALRRDNVELVPHAVCSATETGVIDTAGREHDVDVLIMATGFRPAEFLAELDVVGRDGRTIHEVWAGEPEAFLGVTVPGFPNFFMLYGPNTNFYAIVFNLEQQASYAVRAITRMRRHGATSVEVRPSFTRAYNRWLAWKMRNSAWHTVNNYFTSASGRVVTQWPDGAVLYWLLTRLLGRPSSQYRRVPREPGPAAAAHGSQHREKIA
jgi:cation diffusion facilitator CzcD-associated flavoprotein CzcO